MNERYLLQRIVKDWRHKHTFLRHLLRAHLHDIPHFQSKLYELFVHFCLVFSPSPLTLPLTPAVTYVPLSDAEMSTTQINLTRINERNLSHFIGIVSTLHTTHTLSLFLAPSHFLLFYGVSPYLFILIHRNLSGKM